MLNRRRVDIFSATSMLDYLQIPLYFSTVQPHKLLEASRSDRQIKACFENRFKKACFAKKKEKEKGTSRSREPGRVVQPKPARTAHSSTKTDGLA
jgi:hypothetical protein